MQYRCVLKCVAAGSAGPHPVRCWLVGDLAIIESDDYADFYKRCRKRRHHFVAVEGEIPRMRPQPPKRTRQEAAALIGASPEAPEKAEVTTESPEATEEPTEAPEEAEKNQAHGVEKEAELDLEPLAEPDTEPAQDPPAAFKCLICEREFKNEPGLKRHMTVSGHK